MGKTLTGMTLSSLSDRPIIAARSVKKSNEGLYKCLVKNPVEHLKLNFEFVSSYFMGNVWLMLLNFLLFLTVDPPHITRNLEDKSITIGADITFRIEASGDSLEFQSKKNGDDIDGNESQLWPNTSTLHIPSVKESDKDCYKCI